MFRKPVKVKTFFNLKSSDKKKLHASVKRTFSVDEENILYFFPSKEPISCHRLITSSKEIVTVYGCQNKPLFFEIDEIIYPTIFLLWLCPTIIPYIPIHKIVIDKLVNGADLMIPGVTINLDFYNKNEIDKGTVVCICTLQNRSAVAIGVTTVSTKYMLPGNKGKAVHIYHTVNDELCKLFDIKECILPSLDPLISEKSTDIDISKKIKNLLLPSEVDLNGTEIKGAAGEPFEDLLETLNISHLEPKEVVPEHMTLNATVIDSVKDDEKRSDMTMDDLIMFCFLNSLKTNASKIKLPVLTNIFYKNYMLEAVPKDSSIDIKKSKYKKLSNFLTEVAEKGLICLHTDKGVQTIISIDYNHETIKNFKVEKQNEISENKSPIKFEVEEKYVINGSVDFIFAKCNYKKGDHLSDQELRKCITTYVKSGNLVDPNNDQYITLDDVLCGILGTKERLVTWKELFHGICKKMSNSYCIKTPYNGIITSRGKLPSIKLSTVTKASNKKVTLVDNLELYGININEFSKQCQHGVAASSTINTLPNSKVVQIQIQGNQKKFITQLLTEKYGIPKRFIEGCEEQKKKEVLSKRKGDSSL